MRKNPHLEPKELDKAIISKTLCKLPMKDIKPLKRIDLSDMGIRKLF